VGRVAYGVRGNRGGSGIPGWELECFRMRQKLSALACSRRLSDRVERGGIYLRGVKKGGVQRENGEARG